MGSLWTTLSFARMIKRRTYSELLRKYAGYFPVTAIFGPRQCGKTTLAKAFVSSIPDSLYLDLERPADLAKLTHPEDFLNQHSHQLVCLDEIQRVPELFPLLRSLYRTAAGTEMDLVVSRGQKTIALEMKGTVAPKLTKGFWTTLDDIKPAACYVVAPVAGAYPFAMSPETITRLGSTPIALAISLMASTSLWRIKDFSA